VSAGVQKEHGHSPIAHPILEALAAAGFSASQYAVLLVLIRETYGWSRRDAAISLGDFAERARAHKTTIQRALEPLIAEGVVLVIEPATFTGPATYRLQKDPREWGRFSVTPPSLGGATSRERAQVAQAQGGSADAYRGGSADAYRGGSTDAYRGGSADATSQRGQVDAAAQVTEPESKGKQGKARTTTFATANGAGAPPVESPAGAVPPPPPAELDDRAFCALIAPAVRDHLWLEGAPPRVRGVERWRMDNELSIAKQFRKQFTPAELVGAITVARRALQWSADKPLSLAFFNQDGRRQFLHTCVALWRHELEAAPQPPGDDGAPDPVEAMVRDITSAKSRHAA
jgi:hypothetical protein